MLGDCLGHSSNAALPNASMSLKADDKIATGFRYGSFTAFVVARPAPASHSAHMAVVAPFSTKLNQAFSIL
jgi:hypothetical protein